VRLPADVLERVSDVLQSDTLSRVCLRLWAILRHRHITAPAVTRRTAEAIFRRLAEGCHRVHSLTLCWQTGDSSSFEHVADFPALDGLLGLRRLALQLRGCRLQGDSLCALKSLNALPVLDTVHLDLSFNAIGPAGVQDLLALRTNPHLRRIHLNLGHNVYLARHRSDSVRLAQALVELRFMPLLSELVVSLNDNGLGPEGARALLPFKESAALRTLVLDLGWNEIGDAGALALAAAFQQATGLTSLTLDLQDNYIHQPASHAALRALAEENTTRRAVTLRL